MFKQKVTVESIVKPLTKVLDQLKEHQTNMVKLADNKAAEIAQLELEREIAKQEIVKADKLYSNFSKLLS